MEITKSKEEKIKEPFIRIIGREDLNWKKKALVRAICLFSGVVLCIISLWIIGKKDPSPLSESFSKEPLETALNSGKPSRKWFSS